MRAAALAFAALTVTAAVLGVPVGARADETDNLTCRGRLSLDSEAVLDAWVNARIQEAVAHANRRCPAACDAAGLADELHRRVGGSTLHPWTWIPKARLERWIPGQRDVDRCHLGFGETIYGARPYNQPWLFPFLGRIIWVADSILVAGHVVGLDKIGHFLREGFAHWRQVERNGEDIASSVAREWGPPHRQFRWTEYGLKGHSLTGIVSYADVAAGYWGFRFWSDLLSLDRGGSFVTHDAHLGRFTLRRVFRFDEYVNDAWDEAINPSRLHPTLEREVQAALQDLGLTLPVTDCRSLAALPDARLYVNPACLSPSVTGPVGGW
jgi:hypothetical protein